MNGKYLINRRNVCFRCNLNERIAQLKSAYKIQPPSLICSTKQITFEVPMTKKFHTQKIALIGCIFIQSAYEVIEEEEVKNRWKK
jgi:hypothetical protein